VVREEQLGMCSRVSFAMLMAADPGTLTLSLADGRGGHAQRGQGELDECARARCVVA